MKIHTKYHGVREYNEDDVITFKRGIPGFEELKKFIIFQVEDNEVFNILHSIENEDLGFVVVSPFYVMEDYEFHLTDRVIEELKIKSPEDALVLNTVTLSSKLEDVTTNLQAPIIINIKEKLGEQIIVDNGKYKIKHPLFKEWYEC